MQIAKVHFRYKIWFIISEKDITKCMFFRGGHEAPKILTRHIKKNYIFLILSALKLLSSGLVVLQIWTHIILQKTEISLLKESYKHFWKKVMQIVLSSCYIFIKKVLNMVLKMILIVLMEFLYLIHCLTTVDSTNTFKFQQVMNLTAC